VPSALDEQPRLIHQHRLAPAQRVGAFGQGCKCINERDRRRRALQRCQRLGQRGQKGLIEFLSRARARSRAPSTWSSNCLSSGVMKRSADLTVCRRR